MFVDSSSFEDSVTRCRFMKITWVNHASFLITEGPVGLLVDPWLRGRIFDESWDHLIETPIGLPDWAQVTHIWFSHEHPDHFFPPNVKAIPSEHRAHITVIYQRTHDQKVIQFCQKQGFKEAIEIGLEGQILDETTQFKIQVGAWDGGDSYSLISTPSQTILNLNDCVVDSNAKIDLIRRQLQNSIDHLSVLMAQFSYASWAGNPGDVETRKANSKEKYDRLQRAITALQPKVYIPFASYVYFCHEQNFHMNTGANPVWDVCDFIEHKLGTGTVVLAPGDVWSVDEPHSNERALTIYVENTQKRLNEGPAVRSKKIEAERLLAEARRWTKWLVQQNPILPVLIFLKTRIHVIDLAKDIILERGTVRWVDAKPGADISLYSDALLYAFSNPWGFNTLHVNGRFNELRKGGMHRAFRYFNLADYANRGEGLTLVRTAKKVLKKAVVKAINLYRAGFKNKRSIPS